MWRTLGHATRSESRARIGPTIALTSLTIVASELILTRIFSVVLWYHFAFFAISVALFGLGVAALAVHFFQHRLPEAHTDRHLALGAMGQALALVDIRLLDHFVVGDGEPVSLAERGLYQAAG